MSILDLRPGDPWPFTSSRGLVGSPCPPVWHALITAPQQESRAKKLLTSAGTEVVYPTETRARQINGKLHKTTRPMISRIVYAKFTYEPQWDTLRERRVIQGVFSRQTTPIALSGDDVARVMGLPTEAERLEAERIEAERPRAGEKAEIITGPLQGFFVDVDRVEFGRVWFETATGIKGEVPENQVRRIAD